MKKYVVVNEDGRFYWQHGDMSSYNHETPTVFYSYEEALDKVYDGIAISKLLAEKLDLKPKVHNFKVAEWKSKYESVMR